MRDDSKATGTARDYYNSDDAEGFYSLIWGGEDIHIGVYESASDSIFDASRRTVVKLASLAGTITEATRVLDIGSGYCGAARHLAKTFGCQIIAVNLSDIENTRARTLNVEQGLDHKIEVLDGSFESLPVSDGAFDLVWSQDAILHSGNREKVLSEVSRVLAPGGRLVFTDPMQADTCPDGVLQRVLDRIHLENLGSPSFYRQAGEPCGLMMEEYLDLTSELVMHYTRVLQETTERSAELGKLIDPAYIQRMKEGLRHWIDAGEKGYLAWGMFRFRKV